MKNLENRTRWIYLLTRVLDTPLWAIYNMLPLILYKSLNATPFQIAMVIALKPAVSILSMYWSAQVNSRPDRLVSNILFARILGTTPFLLFFTAPSTWFVIAAAAIYMTMAVGAVPAWIEVLKRNIDERGRKQTFAYGSAFGYLGGGLLPLLFGLLLDSDADAWSWLFGASAILSLAILLLQRRLKVELEPSVQVGVIRHSITTPWRSAYQLLKSDRSFLNFQTAFMVMGSGLMVIQPVLPIYFVDKLGLSYFELGIAIALCKGISYALASPLWARWMNKVDIFRFTAAVSGIAALFPMLLFLASWQTLCIYLAYMAYGLMQAGSEMSWNLSGTLFAKERDSSLYTSVNIVSIGVRGCAFPALGSYLCGMTSAAFILGLGTILFMTSSFLFMRFSQKEATPFERSLI